MGYTSYLSGEIAITPPIQWRDLQDSPFVRADHLGEWERLVWLRVLEDAETGESTPTRKRAVAIRPSKADDLRAYDLVPQVQEIVTAHSDRTFSGHILVRGEESPDIWRVRVHNGRAVGERPMLVWPDGTQEPAQ